MTRRRVAIDAGPLLAAGGISNYVRPLVEALVRVDPETDYRLILRRGWARDDRATVLGRLAPVSSVRVPDRLLGFWWDRLGLALPGWVWPASDVFLSTCLLAPALARGHLVSIVYDCIPLRLPELFPDRRRFRRTLERLVCRSARVIAISQRTREDLIDLLGADPARVRVVYPGCRALFRPVPPAEAAVVAARHGIRGSYVLYVGGLGPHKNLATLLGAYERARLEGGLAARLVVVGHPRWGAAILATLEALRVRPDVLLAGPVPDDDLPGLYAGAQFFVFPSRYEGFGLPVLEAMACGTPVVIAGAGALPEVAGAAGCYVDPDDEWALADRMCEIAGDPERRARMRSAGLEQAARFSWERSAGEVAALLGEITGGPGDLAMASAASERR